MSTLSTLFVPRQPLPLGWQMRTHLCLWDGRCARMGGQVRWGAGHVGISLFPSHMHNFVRSGQWLQSPLILGIHLIWIKNIYIYNILINKLFFIIIECIIYIYCIYIYIYLYNFICLYMTN